MRKPLAARVAWYFLSIPILIKMVGIGAIVAGCFGVITFLSTRNTLKQNLDTALAARTISETESLADYLARPLSIDDIVRVHQILEKTRERHHGILYILVRDPNGKILAHTFDGAVPAELVSLPAFLSFPANTFRVLDAKQDGLVFEALRLVSRGHGGSVQLGWSNELVARELASLRNTILTSLAICAALGIGLALLLSLAITHPVHRLDEAVQQIRQRNLGARAPVFSADEIGSLATAFNGMAETLAENDKTINEKEKARAALVQRIITAQERERKVISRELHDQVGQSLLALLVDMQSPHDSGRCDRVCVRHQARIQDLIEDVRQVSKGMHPAILDDYGLDSALRTYVKDVSERHRVRIDYETTCSGDGDRLPEAMETALYRVAQEAISNALRHAEPSHISVILLVDSETVTLLVEDDGAGLPADRAAQDKGLGLLSMRERCSLLGGELDIISESEQGTTIRARIPVKERDASRV